MSKANPCIHVCQDLVGDKERHVVMDVDEVDHAYSVIFFMELREIIEVIEKVEKLNSFP